MLEEGNCTAVAVGGCPRSVAKICGVVPQVVYRSCGTSEGAPLELPPEGLGMVVSSSSLRPLHRPSWCPLGRWQHLLAHCMASSKIGSGDPAVE
jgi:hypothetical protein